MHEIQILTPDGQTRKVPLHKDTLTLGRSSATDLCYADDAGLSRQHLAIELHNGEWKVRDLGSKNGTLLNGIRITGPSALKLGDRITAGHLILLYDDSSDNATRAVVFVESEVGQPGASTVITDFENMLHGTPDAEAVAGSTHVSALIRAGNELAGERPLPELFRLILDLSISAVSAERGVLMTIEDGKLVVRANKGEGFRISKVVRDRVIDEHVSVLVRNTELDDAFRERRSIVEQNIRTLMAVPLQTREQIIGLIYVDSPSLMREFTKDDLNLLTVMANVAAIRIEHSRFAEIEQARKVLEHDLDQAAEIQRQYLPAVAPCVLGLDLAGHNAACRTVGGDYFDFFPYEHGRVALVLGDVSGKGMPASLMMMGLQARVQVLIDEPASLARTITNLNRTTCKHCPENKFISFFACIVDGATGDLLYANAGHNPPLLVRGDGHYDLLEAGGPPLGILPAMEFQQYPEKLEPGDLLVIYSDGVTEAENIAGDQFEMERLGAVLAANRTKPATAIVEAVTRALVEWTAGSAQGDDITLMIARRN